MMASESNLSSSDISSSGLPGTASTESKQIPSDSAELPHVSGVKRKATGPLEARAKPASAATGVSDSSEVDTSAAKPSMPTIAPPSRTYTCLPTTADTGASMTRANKLLLSAGIKASDLPQVSHCLRAAIGKKKIPFSGKPEDLDYVITSGPCLSCDVKGIAARVRDVLWQPDYGGHDYEDGGKKAGVKCPNTHCNMGIYVTGMCKGKPEFDSGKFHNHCTQCKNGGTCIGDYREIHCFGCGKHTWGGMGTDRCLKCGTRI